MEAATKKLQELGAFILAGAHGPRQLGIVAEMIRAACDYRWVGIYKIKRSDFGINPGQMEEKVSDDIELNLSIAGAAQRG